MPTLRSACTVVSPPCKPHIDDPSITNFYRDLVEPFGDTVDETLLRSGPNVFHSDLVDELAATEEMRSWTPDLVVIAHALPDVHPFTTVASHTNMLFGGQATSFSICEQGLAAPFTALRTVDGFQREGRCQQALVAVLEQTTLPTHHDLVHDTPLVDSGVLLGFDAATANSTTRVERTQSPMLTEQRLVELSRPDPENTLLVLGPWMHPLGPVGKRNTYHVEPGTYCTSVWLAWAKNHERWQRDYRRIVLCDTEPDSGHGHLAVIEMSSDEQEGRQR